MNVTTVGVSPKLKLGATFASIATAVLTALAIIFPDTLSPELVAAITGVIVAIAAAIGTFRGEPGEVIGAIPPEDQLQAPPMDLHADPDATPPT